MSTTSKLLAMAFPAFFALGCGCSGTREPVQSVPLADIRNSSCAVSGNMLYGATNEALQNALNSPEFSAYLGQYKKLSSGKLPLLQIGDVQNDTNDPDLQSKLIATQIADGLFRAGRTRILEDDAVKRQNKGAAPAESSPEMPDLLLTGTVTANVDKADMATYEVIILSLQISDVKTCQNVWRFSTSFGTKRTKLILGK